MQKTDIKSLNIGELTELVKSFGEPAFRAKQLYDWMHVKLVDSVDAMSNLPKGFREKIKESCYYTVLEAVQVFESKLDGTCKFLFRIPEEEQVLKNNVIESVLMRYRHGNSVCISSQVGCRMGCKFCASTLGGLERNLTAAEMLEQIYRIQQISGERVDNVVVMGTGEPMDNLEHLFKFLQMLSDEHGLHISKRNVTVSTCGLPDGIRRLADEGADCTLALSLHAPNDELRKTLMPIANKVSIKEALAATDYYFEKTGRRISFEYSLVSGVNDSLAHAQELAGLLKGRNCHVNLIPVNPIAERDFKASAAPNVAQFAAALEAKHINATVRRTLGSDISASCGQLRKSYSK